jgi:hypothetical protein
MLKTDHTSESCFTYAAKKSPASAGAGAREKVKMLPLPFARSLKKNKNFCFLKGLPLLCYFFF